MAVARPDAPGKLAALRRLADNEPGAQEISAGDSNHLLRHGLVDLDRLPDGRRQHTITAAGWALLGEHAAPGSLLRSANPPRPGHGVAVGDVVAYADGRTLSGAYRVRHALVCGFDDTDDTRQFVLLDMPGQSQQARRPLPAVTRVDPPIAWYREDLSGVDTSAARCSGSKDEEMALRMVTFQGKTYEFARADVETRMRGLAPERITKYFVVLNANAYPVKQVARTCTGVRQQNTRESQKLLRDLGFPIHQT